MRGRLCRLAACLSHAILGWWKSCLLPLNWLNANRSSMCWISSIGSLLVVRSAKNFSATPDRFCVQRLRRWAGNRKRSTVGNLRASLINALGDLNDPEITAGCRERFEKYLANPASLAPDLRPSVLAVVGRYADEKTWSKLHELGLKTTSIEEKQNYYNALAEAIDPKLVKKTLPIALTDELP